MNPRSHEVHIQHTFDAFCKKVLKNEALDYHDEIARKSKKEILFSGLPVEVMEQLSSNDRYFKEDKTFGVLGHIVYIDNEELAEAIAALSDEKRAIILLAYFLEMSDYEIAKALKMVRRTITYRRTSTLKLLKKLIGGRPNDD